MSDVSNTGTLGATADPNFASSTVAPPVTQSKWYRLRQSCASVVRYLLDSEVHTYAFSVAANAIISFIPFVVLLYTLSLSVFHSHAMADVVDEVVRYYLPSTAHHEWMANSLEAVAVMSTRHGVQALSLVMILISCTGIFLPLEVALNQAWGVTKSRNYLLNQLVAFGLAILMVALAMASVVAQRRRSARCWPSSSSITPTTSSTTASARLAHAVYRRSVDPVLLLDLLVVAQPRFPAPPGAAHVDDHRPHLAASRYIFVTVLPYLDLKALYGPFFVSVGLLFWAYISGLILFAGAQFSVTRED